MLNGLSSLVRDIIKPATWLAPDSALGGKNNRAVNDQPPGKMAKYWKFLKKFTSENIPKSYIKMRGANPRDPV